MRVIFYIASQGQLWDKTIGFWTHGPYSHCELLFSDGMCFSSSPRDGGVRFKQIDISSIHWDTIEILMDTDKENNMRKWCETQVGMSYDWFGILGLAVNVPIRDKNKWYCSEICITALDMEQVINLFPRINPNKFYKSIPKSPIAS